MLNDFEGWLRVGYEEGWIGPPVCITHDGLPTTPTEDDDDEPCIHVVRLYTDPDERTAVEANHPPSRWRATNRGLTPDASD